VESYGGEGDPEEFSIACAVYKTPREGWVLGPWSCANKVSIVGSQWARAWAQANEWPQSGPVGHVTFHRTPWASAGQGRALTLVQENHVSQCQAGRCSTHMTRGKVQHTHDTAFLGPPLIYPARMSVCTCHAGSHALHCLHCCAFTPVPSPQCLHPSVVYGTRTHAPKWCTIFPPPAKGAWVSIRIPMHIPSSLSS
jgi:hypothetical protein